MGPQNSPEISQTQFVLGDDGEINPEGLASLKSKEKRKRGAVLVNRYGLVRAFTQIVLIGIPVSLLTAIIMLQATGVIKLQLPDGKLHLEGASPCTGMDRSFAAEAYRRAHESIWNNVTPKGFSVGEYVDTSGIPNLYLFDAKGNPLKPLTENDQLTVRYEYPQVSPDSNLIAFNKTQGNTSSAYVMNTDGSNLRLLSGNYYAEVANWSPDSKSLAFTTFVMNGDQLLSTELYTVDIATLNIKQLASAKRNIWSKAVQWSPDNKWIAFNSENGVSVISPDGGQQREVLSTLAGVEMWSSDSKYLVLFQTDGVFAVDSSTFMSACRLA